MGFDRVFYEFDSFQVDGFVFFGFVSFFFLFCVEGVRRINSPINHHNHYHHEQHNNHDARVAISLELGLYVRVTPIHSRVEKYDIQEDDYLYRNDKGVEVVSGFLLANGWEKLLHVFVVDAGVEG